MNAYMIVGPMNLNPRFARAFDIATDTGVLAGTDFIAA
jgi:hypothetical protein